jgi:predicted nucleotidyltransferase
MHNTGFLNPNEKKAAEEIKSRISVSYPGTSFILFGSKARGDFHLDSDIDLLAIVDAELPWQEIDKVISDVYDVNLLFGTLFTVHIVSKQKWKTGHWSCFPLKESVEKEGVAV